MNILSVMIEGIVAVPLMLTQILSIPENSVTHVARDVDPLHVFHLNSSVSSVFIATSEPGPPGLSQILKMAKPNPEFFREISIHGQL